MSEIILTGRKTQINNNKKNKIYIASKLYQKLSWGNISPLAFSISKLNNYHNNLSHVTRKPVVCNQVRLNMAYSATKASKSLEILVITSINIILSKQRTTKTLSRLCGCGGWSASLLFAYGIRQVFIWRGTFIIEMVISREAKSLTTALYTISYLAVVCISHHSVISPKSRFLVLPGRAYSEVDLF